VVVPFSSHGERPVRFLRKGKVKEVYEVSEDELEFVFTDQISVFDKVIPTLVPHKGETLCRTSAHWFRIVGDLGVRTHFLGVVDGNRMRVRRVNVISDYDKITPSSRNFLIPLEVIARYYVAGSFHDRIKEGKIRPEDAGFPRGHVPGYGEPLPEPFVEVTTKLEKVDRELTVDEALKISKLSAVEYNELVEAVLKIDERLNSDVKRRGLIHVDGKKEFAMDGERRLMLVDTFGTADEDRFWDLEEYKKGHQIELSKEFVRQYYRQIGYHKALMEARAAGKPEPDIPRLPPEVTKQVSALYVDLLERLTGEKFR
jgi:phosphoribosylaminoimidazole-succinocarboxamide synthase